MTSGSPVFTRPGGNGQYFYVAIRVNFTSSGNYIFRSSSNLDTYGCLYNKPFVPSTPTTNLVVSDDDSAGNSQFQFTVTAQSGTTAILVVTTYSTGTTGSITIRVNGPRAMTFVVLPNPTTSTSGSTTAIYSAALTSGSPVFTRPEGNGRYFYAAVQVNFPSSGNYNFRSSSTLDTYGCLYSNPFVPTTPTTNLIVSDDDSAGNNQFEFTVTAQPGATATLVVTTYSTSATGSITVTVTGPNAVTFGLIYSEPISGTQTASVVRSIVRLSRAARSNTGE